LHAYESPGGQVLLLFLLAIPVACASWTITHEEIFKELHEFCLHHSQSCKRIYQQILLCVDVRILPESLCDAALLIITEYRLVYDSWRGYLMADLSIVWIANFYMAIFGRLRLELKSQKLEIAEGERRAESESENSPFSDSVSLGTFRERR
jgi:hypothetical protein